MKVILEIIGCAFAVLGGVFWAGWYAHSTIASVEFHEKEMQLYHLHQQIEDGYKNEIRQLEADKRELEKEVYELRKETINKEYTHE